MNTINNIIWTAKKKGRANLVTILLLFLTLLSFSSYASHIVGGSISYKCDDSNGIKEYEITLRVYRDCEFGASNAQFDSPASIGIFAGANQSTNTLITDLRLFPIGDDTIEAVIDDCLFVPDDVCVHTTTYRGTVTLQPSQVGYQIVYQRCCRNHTISNIIDPDMTGASYTIGLTDQAMDECNNSPTFNQYPPIFICVGRPIDFDHSATDDDGDSLSYRLCTPIAGATFNNPRPQPPIVPYDQPIIWDEGYGLDDVLGGTGDPLQINPSSGHLTGDPTIQGQFVVGVCVDEFRNGVRLSTTRRDFQYNVGECEMVEAVIEAPDGQCENLTVEFVGENSPHTEEYQWFFNYPNDMTATSTLANPTYTYPDTGTYVIKLIAEPGSPCEDISFDTIQLYNNTLSADFRVETFDCGDSTVVALIDASIDDVSMAASWNWELVYGQTTLTSDEESPVFSVPTNVSVTVTLNVTSQIGCTSTITQEFITGADNPDEIIPDTVMVCRGNGVMLNPEVDPATTYNYVWSPSEGLDDPNSPNPVATVTENTVYSVTVSPANNICNFTKEVTVLVFDPPALSYSAEESCDGLTVTFTNESENTDSFSWTIGDITFDNENPTITFDSAGFYDIILTGDIRELCPDTLRETIEVREKTLEAAIEVALSDCTADSVTVTFLDATVISEDTVVAWEWTFSNGETSDIQNPELMLTTDQQIIATLKVTTSDDCMDTVQDTFDIELIDLNIPDTVRVCMGSSVELNPNPDLDFTYEWTPEEGLDDANSPNPVATVTENTTYTVNINAINNACSFVETVEVIVIGITEAAFIADSSSCDGLTVFFTNQSVNADSYTWIFDESGLTSTEVNPSYTFDSVGTYPVTLIANLDDVCPDTLTQNVEVTAKTLQAAIDVDIPECTPDSLTLTFVDASVNSENNTVAWDWTFSNGDVSEEENPVITFYENQEITASLQITTAEGCTDSTQMTFNVQIIELNLPDTITVCAGESASLNPNGNPDYTYQWEPATGLDDPTAVNPTVTPTETTTYTVTVTAISGDTCQVEAAVTVVVPPPFDLTVGNNNIVTCEAVATLSGSSAVDASYVWTNEAGDTLSTNADVTVNVSGEMTYTLTATDENGCSMEEMVTVTGGPVDVEIEGGNAQAFCEGDSIVITVNNLDPNDTLTYVWGPDSLIVAGGDGPSATILDTPGEHVITVTVENQYECSTTETINVAVIDTTMMLSFTKDLECTGTTVNFTNTSTNAFGYIWDFGDPNNPDTTSTETNPTYTYSEPGVYTVCLTIVYDVECTDTVCMNVTTLETQLMADFSYSFDDCATGSVTIQFTDDSINESGVPITWNWDFGNSETSTLQNPVLVVTDTQTLNVTLIVATEDGACSDTTSQMITIEPTEIADIADTLIICPDMMGVNLNPGGDTSATYIWTPATGLDDATSANPFASPMETTTYTVMISSVAGSDTCMVTDSVVVIVSPDLTVDAGPDVVETCGEDVILVATGSGSTACVWTNEAGMVISNEATVTVNPDDTETYIVTCTNDLNCSVSDTVTVINNEVNINTSNDGADIEACVNEEVTITVQNLDDADTLTYMWSTEGPGMIISGADSDTVVVIGDPSGPTTFTVIATNQFECSDTIDVVVTITPFVVEGIPEMLTACFNIPTPVSPDANPDFIYEWSPADCVDDPTSSNPMVMVTEDKILSVTITDPATGCTTETTVAVDATPPINLSATKDTTLCEITELVLVASTTVPVSFTWLENGTEFSSAADVTTDSVTVMPPEGGTTYTVIATDAFGCMQEASIIVDALEIDGNLAGAITNCVGEGVTLAVTDLDTAQNLTFVWSPDELILDGQGTSTVSVDPSETTTFSVTLEDTNSGCTTTLSSLVTAINLPAEVMATATPDSLVLGTSTVLDAGTNNPDYTYTWEPSGSITDPNASNTQASPTEDTEYTVTVNSANAECSASSSVFVRVVTPLCEFPHIFLPNAFTPNDDGENDELRIFGNFIEEMELIIYNRWGQKVFESRDQSLGWDGTFNGKILQPDVYGYYLRVLCVDGEELIEKGNISLLK